MGHFTKRTKRLSMRKLIPIYKFEESKEYIKKLDENSLVIFDVDSVLHEFIKFDHPYKQIFLFDDKEKNITSIEKMLESEFPKTTFLGFHYKEADLLPSPEIVSEQEILDYLHSLLSKVRNIS